MNSIKSLLFLVLLLSINGAFAQNREIRKVSSFNKLEVGGSLDYIIEQGDENSVTIESKGIDPEKIITEVKGDVLQVYLEEGNYRNVRGTVYITYQNLEGINKSGSGNLRSKSDLSAPEFKFSKSGSGNTISEGNIRAEELSIDVSGSGSVTVASLDAKDFDLSMSGSGDVEVDSGTVSNFSIRKSGSGEVNASGVKSNVCSVHMSGSGDVKISADKSIEARMSGSGSILYKGDAMVNRIEHSGSGEISKR